MVTSATSGFTRTYTDPSSGVTIINAWIQIRQINYIPSTSCLVVADVYLDESAYTSGKSPIFYNILPPVNSTDPDWMTYFDVSVMDEANHDIQYQSLTYLEGKLP